MPKCKFFCLSFIYVLIFNFYKPCFSLPSDPLDSKRSDWYISMPLDLVYSNPPSNNDNHFERNSVLKYGTSSYNPPYNPHERVVYANMAPHQFKKYFENELDEGRILKNYELYAYEGFRSFVRTLPSYQKFMLSLDEKIKNDKSFRTNTTYMPGFSNSFSPWKKKSGFHDFVHDEAEKIRKNNPGYYDYSSQVPPPIQGDRYAAVFKNTYGTMRDCELHKELHQTRTSMIQLERTFPYNDHVQFVAPLVHYLAARAKAEKNSATAWELSKFCRTITSVVLKCARILDTCLKTGKSIGKGLIKGAKKVLTVEHWKEMATGALQLGLFFVKAVNQHEENKNAAFTALLSHDKNALSKFDQEYALNVKNHISALNQSIKQTYQKIQTMTWEELLEKSVEVGTTLVLDTLALYALNGLVSRASHTIVEELSNALEKGTRYATEEYMVEVACFGKIAVKEGAEVAQRVGEIACNTPSLFPTNKSVVDMLHETSMGVKQWVHLKISDLKNIYNFNRGALEHILEGEVNAKGYATGFHYEGIVGSKGKIIPGTKKSFNQFGVYEAKVEVNGLLKTSNGGLSTFFPKHWTPQEVVDAINEAFNNKVFVQNTRNTFRGETSCGMQIEMFIDNKTNKIISAYPKY